MNPIKILLDKLNSKKNADAWEKLNNMIKYQDRAIITLPTAKGYATFFQKMKEHNLDYRIDDSLKNCIFITVTKNDKKLF